MGRKVKLQCSAHLTPYPKHSQGLVLEGRQLVGRRWRGNQVWASPRAQGMSAAPRAIPGDILSLEDPPPRVLRSQEHVLLVTPEMFDTVC